MGLTIKEMQDFLPSEERFKGSTNIGSTRKIKFCAICSSDIPAGSSHVALEWRTDDGFTEQDPLCINCLDEHGDSIEKYYGTKLRG